MSQQAINLIDQAMQALQRARATLAGAPQPPEPPPPPPPPPPPDPGDPSINVPKVYSGVDFSWPNTGQVIDWTFEPGAYYVFGYDVPAGYAGFLQHVLLHGTTSPEIDAEVDFYEATEIGGRPLPNSRYSGMVIRHMATPDFYKPIPGARQYFHLRVKKHVTIRLQQVHQ